MYRVYERNYSNQLNSLKRHHKLVVSVLFLSEIIMCRILSDPSWSGSRCHHSHGFQSRGPWVCFCHLSLPAESRVWSLWLCSSWWRLRGGGSCASIFSHWLTLRASRR